MQTMNHGTPHQKPTMQCMVINITKKKEKKKKDFKSPTTPKK